MPSTDFVCVDWGTSSFRLWHLSAGGVVKAERRSSQGMASLARKEFGPVLEKVLDELDVDLNSPVIICGMAGAAQGWQEAKYLDLPTKLDSIPAHATRVDGSERDVRILPGLAQRLESAPDVIRGEETLILGAQLKGYGDGLYCLPGTHSKWIEVNSGAVTRFNTVMTGELFALLSNVSTLAAYAKSERKDLYIDASFEQGVRDALNHPKAISSQIFSARATPLVFGNDKAADMPARLSGLLIGSELAAMDRGKPVTLVANSGLEISYKKALQIAGITSSSLSSDDLALSGLIYAAEAIWGK
jgi:2-dehydro-3-deoxygalactonokinase